MPVYEGNWSEGSAVHSRVIEENEAENMEHTQSESSI